MYNDRQEWHKKSFRSSLNEHVIASDQRERGNPKNNIVCFCFGLLRNFFPCNDVYRTAFTLAEVLITLAVIGVVSALTIPTLLQSIQQNEFTSAFKRNYSDFVQAGQQIINDNGGSAVNFCTGYAMWPGQNCTSDTFARYLSTVRKCNWGTAQGNCWHANGVAKDKQGNDYDAYNSSTGIVLANGAFAVFETYATDVAFGTGCGSAGNNNYVNTTDYVRIHLDVNGGKGPNILGRDIFEFVFGPRGVLPSLSNLPDPDGCDINTAINRCSTLGYSCDTLILSNRALP